jgi:hypothetical protein
MKFCPNCGAELKPEAKFCAACGTPIAVASPPPSQAAPPPPPPVYQQEPVYEHAREASSAFKEAISGKTNIVQRVINIITKPKQEWEVIATEQPDKLKLLFGYVMLLALIPAVITFINFSVINDYFSVGYAIVQAAISFVLTIAVIYLTAFIVDALAPSFDSEKNFERSFQLVCYAYTPGWLASIFGIIPGLNMIAPLVGFGYMIYLFLTGMPVIKKTPNDKATAYTIITILILIVIYFVLAAILAFVFLKTLFKGIMFSGM